MIVSIPRTVRQAITHIAPRSIESQRLLWPIAALAFAFIPHLSVLPPWVPLLAACIAMWRIVIEVNAWRLPPRWLRIVIALAGIVAVAASFRTLNGLDAGTALLATMAGVKLLETRDRRDHTVLVFIGYVLLFSALLYNQELLRLPYILLAAWILTATLLRIHQSAAIYSPRTALRANLRGAGAMVLQALPLATLLFVFFPRLPGQFWALPSRNSAMTGLSDEMTPGDISELTISGAIAFRVKFDGPIPPPIERYWRGPVLHEFDGRRWRRDRFRFGSAQQITPLGQAYRYRITLEPTQREWLIALDAPTEWPQNRVVRWYDMQLYTRRPIATLTSFELQSHTNFRTELTLSDSQRRYDTSLPGTANPRAREFARQLRASAANDGAYIQAVLEKFRNEEYFYTLQPPSLGDHPVDEFLFETQRGFCEHFASAFTMLMRAAGIPARVVTGYQGGQYNELGDYVLVRQSDAHAWSEVWLENRGWIRIDPTAAIAPQRIERDLSAAMGENEPVPGRFVERVPVLARARLAWDAINNFWNDRVVEYNELKQKSLMERLGIENADWRDLAVAFAVTLVVFLAAMGAYLARQFRPASRDPVARAYDALCRKLAKRQLPREQHEGPMDYLRRAAARQQEIAARLGEISTLYLKLRYGPNPEAGELKQLRLLVRRL